MLDVLVTFPTVLFTVLLGVTAIYWLFVVLGAIDLDFLGGAEDGIEGAIGALKGGAEGAMDGVLGGAKGSAEGAVDSMLGGAKGSAEGAADSVLGGAKGGAEAAADGVAEGADGGGLMDLVAALRLRRAPVTVVVTLFALFGWFLSTGSMLLVAPMLSLPRVGVGFAALVLVCVVSLLLTSLAVRPLERFFVTHQAKSGQDFVGQVCIVSTGSVSTRFGQATLADGGAGLILHIRCEGARLARGDRALIVGFDKETGHYAVEPYDALVSNVAAKAPAAVVTEETLDPNETSPRTERR